MALNLISHLPTAPYPRERPQGRPFVTLALHLRQKHKRVAILTFNKKDFKVDRHPFS